MEVNFLLKTKTNNPPKKSFHMKKLTKNRISCEKRFEMHVKMVQAFVNFRLAVLLMNKNNGGGRIKHTSIKKGGKTYNRKPQKQTEKNFRASCGQVKRFKMVHGCKTSPKTHVCSQITTINQK